ncbi:MAG TPA: isoprenylcysteine carboxylmethyltransferase family protein [Candidatus Dormibacteraeota bacterium]|nr:isoprenylcysteine carboxylmethyltransferase family protein [Candidatus Dormibacteraeota bacterium]
MSISPVYAILALVGVQRVAEVVYAERNARALRARGGVEIAAWQHPFFVALHAAWFLSMAWLVPAGAAVNWYLVGGYALLQLARAWVLATLGARWTTRLIVLPGVPLVRAGPYRIMRHPNYAIVVLEIALLPAAFGAYWIAGTFTLLNALLLTWRVRAEDAALAAGRAG